MMSTVDARDHPETSEGTVAVGGGRRVGFGITGDPGGRPVLWSHGGGGSRRLALGTPGEQAAAEVRMVTVERPGFGLSDDRPGWTLLDCAADTAAVARHLGIDRYVAAGVSAGSRVALACGAGADPGVAAVGVVSGLVPPAWFPDDDLVALAARDPAAAESAVRAYAERRAADIEATVDAMGRQPAPDGPVYARPDVRAQFVATLREGNRSGPGAAARDALLSNLPWGFDLADVRPPVHWWHGTVDPLVPAPVLRRALDGLANYRITLYEGEGHAAGLTHTAEILAGLAALG
jgi:pimeloyl-ACP methyl ester carboxylesterase